MLESPLVRLLHTTFFSSRISLKKPKKARTAQIATDPVARLLHPFTLFSVSHRRLYLIRSIGFTATQVYCTTGTRKVASGVAEMLQYAMGYDGVLMHGLCRDLQDEFARRDSMSAADRTVAGRAPRLTLWN
jgi:hypothetical protein